MSAKTKPFFQRRFCTPVIAELDRSLDRVRRFMVRRLRNPADVDDLAQELYLQLLRVDADRVIDNPLRYLFTRAKYLLADWRDEQGDIVTEPIDDVVDETPSESLSDRLDDYLDISQHVGEVLRLLPPMQAAVLVLFHRDGFSRQEIAARLNLKEDTVKTYLTQARAKVRVRYATGDKKL